jgi:GTP pyrophosphokinase
MVSNPRQSPKSGNIQFLLDSVSKTFAPAEVDLIRKACELAEPLYAGRVELTGATLFQHALGAADILAGMHMDHETIAAAILHAVPEYLADWQEKIGEGFGTGVKMLVAGISRVEQIEQFSEMAGLHKRDSAEAAQQIESLRKMFLAMVEDIRVVIIKLAERTQTMRHLFGASAEQQQRIAQQTRSIFAPLANRLGVWQL